MPEEKKQTKPQRIGNIPGTFIGGLLSVPSEIVGVASEFFANINQSGIKEWVAENVKELKDLMILGKTAIIPTTKAVESTTTYFEQRAKEKMEKETEPKPIDLSKFQITSLPSTTRISPTTIPVGTTKEELAQQERIETMQKVRAEFNNLVQRGFFRDNPDYYFSLMFPFLREVVSNKNGQISSWHFFADWQINQIDELTNAYEIAQRISEEAQKYGLNLSARDVLDGMHARAFDTLYTFQSQGIVKFLFPNLNVSAIKDPHKRTLTENWIASVYRGYKILKQEPPLVIKILYNLLAKGTSATRGLEMGIYSTAQDTQQATGETTEIPTEEVTTETEPEVYTIQTQFLRK
jgi:hypothetical protein